MRACASALMCVQALSLSLLRVCCSSAACDCVLCSSQGCCSHTQQARERERDTPTTLAPHQIRTFSADASTRMHARTHTDADASTRTHMQAYTCTLKTHSLNTSIHVHTCTQMQARARTHMCTSIRASIRTHTQNTTSTHVLTLPPQHHAYASIHTHAQNAHSKHTYSQPPPQHTNPTTQNSPPPYTSSFLGVSPPVRSGGGGGAANPLAHDHNWMGSAYNASYTNLQALKELDSGLAFLSSSQFPASSPKSLDGGWVERVPSEIKAAQQRQQQRQNMACRQHSQAMQMHLAEHSSMQM